MTDTKPSAAEREREREFDESNFREHLVRIDNMLRPDEVQNPMGYFRLVSIKAVEYWKAKYIEARQSSYTEAKEEFAAALAESASRVRGLEQELNKYKIVNKYHAEKLGQLDHLIEKAEAAITTFQWVTNSFKMSPEQQVRLGDAIVGLHDACEAAKDKAIRSGRGERG